MVVLRLADGGSRWEDVQNAVAVLSQRITLLWKLLESGKQAWVWQTGSKTHSGNAETINSALQMAMDSFFVSFF